MMKIQYEDYELIILNEPFYKVNSLDNIREYKLEYKGEGQTKQVSKHGIRIRNKITNTEISSAIICESGGATIIHDNSFIIRNSQIYICVCNKVYCLKLPSLEIEWIKQLDDITNYSINSFKNDFIIHGELEIIRLNQNGDIVWRFGGKDIFVSETGKNNFCIDKSLIEVKDWKGNKYIINEYGQEISYP